MLGGFATGLLVAAEPTPPRAGMAPPRSGTTNAFGSGTITHRSDGTSSQTRPFGSGSITTERSRDGKTVTGPAEERLRRLVALKSSVVSGADHLDDADAALSRLQDLRDGLRNATTTIGDVQHMIVDVMLLQPAVDRAVAALKPVIELTRTARQADPAAMAPRASIESTSDTVNPVVGAAPTADVTK
jgi:hypothetical protein